MSDILDDLRKVARDKAEELDKVRLERMAMENRLREEARVKVWETYGAAETKVSAEAAKAASELRLEMERRALVAAAEKIPYPVGTRMVLWTAGSYAPGVFRASQTRGILEIFKAGDEFPLNMRWSRPAVGDVVVRTLTKDGQLGKKVERLKDRNYLAKWVPEGVSI